MANANPGFTSRFNKKRIVFPAWSAQQAGDAVVAEIEKVGRGEGRKGGMMDGGREKERGSEREGERERASARERERESETGEGREREEARP